MDYEFFGEKIIFPSAPVPGSNNDQSLNTLGSSAETHYNRNSTIHIIIVTHSGIG